MVLQDGERITEPFWRNTGVWRTADVRIAIKILRYLFMTECGCRTKNQLINEYE